jgi:mono/diheme cytochrome c family protein
LTGVLGGRTVVVGGKTMASKNSFFVAAAAVLGLLFLAACTKREAGPAGGGTTPGQTIQAPSQAKAPGFADRSKIPLSGKQGPPGEAASLAGDGNAGEGLFAANCASCHGPRGTDKVPNPGSDDGTVPPLNPIDPNLASKDPAVFAANIDRLIQHGSVPDGPDPALVMPDWGDSQALTQKQIADLEAYVMRLNGVTR